MVARAIPRNFKPGLHHKCFNPFTSSVKLRLFGRQWVGWWLFPGAVQAALPGGGPEAFGCEQSPLGRVCRDQICFLPCPGEQDCAVCPACIPLGALSLGSLWGMGLGVAAHHPPPPSPATFLGMVWDHGTHRPHLSSTSSSAGGLGAPCRSRRLGWGGR